MDNNDLEKVEEKDISVSNSKKIIAKVNDIIYIIINAVMILYYYTSFGRIRQIVHNKYVNKDDMPFADAFMGSEILLYAEVLILIFLIAHFIIGKVIGNKNKTIHMLYLLIIYFMFFNSIYI